jgi:hypothetical protein
MSDWTTLQGQIVRLLVIGIFVLGIIESIFYAKWSPPYFRNGLPVFKKHFAANSFSPEPPPAYELEDRFRSKITNSIVFKEISSTEYAFRYKLFEFGFRIRYGPTIMRGLILWNFDERRVTVKGYINWTTFLFCVLIVVGSIGAGSPAILIPLLFLGLFYGVEALRFSEVGKFAAECWSKY